jgi:hypothetical protein
MELLQDSSAPSPPRRKAICVFLRRASMDRGPPVGLERVNAVMRRAMCKAPSREGQVWDLIRRRE